MARFLAKKLRYSQIILFGPDPSGKNKYPIIFVFVWAGNGANVFVKNAKKLLEGK